MRLCLLPLLLLLLATSWAETMLRPADSARLDNLDAASGNAVMQALAAGEAGDVTALTRALSGEPQVAFSADLQGDWSCRTIKLGGISPLVAYSPFKCRFTATDRGFAFEKLTGSQLTRGEITLRDGRAIYAGVGYVNGETAPDYADLPEDFTSGGKVQSDVAVFQRISPTRARLLFPSPAVESDFDILELTR
ncbi:MAG TPA: DUF4893 domain-containing protein [Sulfitobacter sp.]|jgi:hypothetical protein|uniref:DUF4893 domain-containing protein n=1 Tax=Sulfitobacter dubius TaxID=218673 RepID=UPI000C3EF9F8|nr:DUF4893 domain-containing protein [Sulfitobacter sp.]HBB81946.1 DUF4893 domain-containing protein [Sulfitobacter sp.]